MVRHVGDVRSVTGAGLGGQICAFASHRPTTVMLGCDVMLWVD